LCRGPVVIRKGLFGGDFAELALSWGQTVCSEGNGWFDIADFNRDGSVSPYDLKIFVERWLVGREQVNTIEVIARAQGPAQVRTLSGLQNRPAACIFCIGNQSSEDIKKTGDEVPPVAQAIRSATPSPSKKRGEEKALVSQLFHLKHR
jgi:hypothetical protein